MDTPSGTPSSQFSSSSHSKSSKSTIPGSTDRVDQIEGMSPTDIEVRIQCEQLIAVLDEAIVKTKLVMCLPFLMSKSAILNRVLSPEHLHCVKFIYERYNNNFSMSDMFDYEAVHAIRTGDFSMKKRLGTELTKLIFILFKYPELKNIAKERIDQIEVSEDAKGSIAYLQTLYYFREVMLRRFEKTAAEDLSTKFQHRKTSASNEKLKQEIREIQKTMKEEKIIFEREIKQKTQVKESLKKHLEMLELDGKIAMTKDILDTERQMVLASRTHEVRIDVRREEEEAWVENNASILEKHLSEEKTLRARRVKVTTQLHNWVQKYDAELTEKHEELDAAVAEFEEEDRMIKLLEADLSVQDEQYLPLMEERENEYQEEMNGKKVIFLREHAARVMQHAWRTVLANRKYKAKMKKLLKKLEKAAAAAAKAK